MKPLLSNIRFIFDVESIGLHGQPYAVGYVVHKDGVCVAENSFSCPTDAVPGDNDDRAWVEANCPKLPITHESPDGVMDAFWDAWMYWKKQGAQMFAECAWPVEAHFLSCCIVREYPETKWEGPYPLFDVSSIMAAAGMDPLGTYPRADNEVQHDPLGDARHSATLLAIAIQTLTEKRSVGLTFGDAIAALKQGKRVARAGWNGKGMYLWLLPAASVKAEWCKEPHLKELATENGGEIEALGSIRMLTADKKILTGWLASQTDILAEDWAILE